MSQTSIPASLAKGFVGMHPDMDNNKVRSYNNAETALHIPAGTVVAQHASVDQGVILPVASNAILRGVVQHAHAYAVGVGAEVDATGYFPKAMMDVAIKGTLYMICEEDVTPTSRVYVRYVAGAGGTQLGAIRKTAVGGETIDATGQMVILTTAVAGALVEVAFDFTNLS